MASLAWGELVVSFIQFLYSHQTLIAVHFFRCLAGFVAGSGKEWKCLSFFFASGRVGQLGCLKLIARLWAICSGKLGCLVAGGCTLGQRNNRRLRCGMCKKRYLFERMNNLCAYNLVGLWSMLCLCSAVHFAVIGISCTSHYCNLYSKMEVAKICCKVSSGLGPLLKLLSTSHLWPQEQ